VLVELLEVYFRTHANASTARDVTSSAVDERQEARVDDAEEGRRERVAAVVYRKQESASGPMLVVLLESRAFPRTCLRNGSP
jgi:hypothetical protein